MESGTKPTRYYLCSDTDTGILSAIFPVMGTVLSVSCHWLPMPVMSRLFSLNM